MGGEAEQGRGLKESTARTLRTPGKSDMFLDRRHGLEVGGQVEPHGESYAEIVSEMDRSWRVEDEECK